MSLLLSTMKVLLTCKLIRIDRKSLASISSFKAHEKGRKCLSYSKTNEFLMASSDSQEIAIWDTRNLNKRLFTIKSNDIDSMDFLEGNAPTFMVSS